jgi:hypothetical protein
LRHRKVMERSKQLKTVNPLGHKWGRQSQSNVCAECKGQNWWVWVRQHIDPTTLRLMDLCSVPVPERCSVHLNETASLQTMTWWAELTCQHISAQYTYILPVLEQCSIRWSGLSDGRGMTLLNQSAESSKTALMRLETHQSPQATYQLPECLVLGVS